RLSDPRRYIMFRRLAIACTALALAGSALADDNDKLLKMIAENIAAMEKKVAENPTDAHARGEVAIAHASSAGTYLGFGKVKEADAANRRAIALLEPLVAATPT